MRLVCFPYAGVGASVYRLWSAGLPESVEVCAVQLPGREGRLRETPLTDIGDIVAALVPQILPWLDRPFAFFGHSMGALLATEVVEALSARGAPLPDQLFVSGRRPPHVPDDEPPMGSLPDDLFVAEIDRRFGGIPAAVRADAELMALLMPTLRADIIALERYRNDTRKLLRCPVAVFGGASDRRASRQHLESWQLLTRSDLQLRLFDGDHFYLNPQRPAVLREVAAILAPFLALAESRHSVATRGVSL